MIFDCFTFFNELELLRVRIEEYKDIVDYFVVVEATKTHSGNTKPLHFQENRRFFSDAKIIHVVVDDMPTVSGNRWDGENFQRNAIMRGLVNAKPDDLIIISDADELPRRRVIQAGIEGVCIQRMYYYYLNLFADSDPNGTWAGSALIKYSKLCSMLPQSARMHRQILIPDGGWHFSYLGGLGRVKTKIESFAHGEYDNDSVKGSLADRIKSRKDLFGRSEVEFKVENMEQHEYPKFIAENLEALKEFCLPWEK